MVVAAPRAECSWWRQRHIRSEWQVFAWPSPQQTHTLNHRYRTEITHASGAKNVRRPKMSVLEHFTACAASKMKKLRRLASVCFWWTKNDEIGWSRGVAEISTDAFVLGLRRNTFHVDICLLRTFLAPLARTVVTQLYMHYVIYTLQLYIHGLSCTLLHPLK